MYLQVAEGTAFFNSALERITTIQDKVRDLTTARAMSPHISAISPDISARCAT